MVSFIVPVFNMEKYVERCIDSILFQEISDWELIAINDGSSDRSPVILDEYSNRDSRIKVIHKKNEGIASAVRDGLQQAEGDYIAFVDSDDYIRRDMLKILHTYIGQYDIIQFGMVRENENGEVLGNIKFSEETLRGSETILLKYLDSYRMPSLACRIFKKELFTDIDMSGRNIGIDEMLTLQLMGKADSLISISEILYHIYVRTHSVSRREYSHVRIDEIIMVHKFLWQYIKEFSTELVADVLAKNIGAHLGMFAFCESNIFSEERVRIEKGLQDYIEYSRQYGVWKSVKRKVGFGLTVYLINKDLYRLIQQKRSFLYNSSIGNSKKEG